MIKGVKSNKCAEGKEGWWKRGGRSEIAKKSRRREGKRSRTKKVKIEWARETKTSKREQEQYETTTTTFEETIENVNKA